MFTPAPPEFPKSIDFSSLDDSFHIARARAIERYAGLEQALSYLFAVLLNTHPELAGVVFFRITSVGYRNKIIASLLEKRFSDKYKTFWHGTAKHRKDGLFNVIQQLDDLRNPIVHWHTTINVNPDGVATHFALIPPNFWEKRPDRPTIITGQLDEFSNMASFAAGIVDAFATFVTNPRDFPKEIVDALPHIFSQPVNYPPPDTHPLSPNYKGQQNPPQSSEA